MFREKLKRWGDSIGQLAALAALVAGCAIVSWEAWPVVGNWHRQRLARQIAAEIPTIQDQAVGIPIHQLAALGSPALSPLVEAAASERFVVAEAARQVLEEKFASWQSQLDEGSYSDVSEAMLAFATALAAQIDNFGPAGKQWAGSLALRMIDLAEIFPVDVSAKLLSQSSHVLEHVPPRGPRLQSIETVSKQPLLNENLVDLSLPQVDLRTLAAPLDEIEGSLVAPFDNLVEAPHAESSPERASRSKGTWSPQWNVRVPRELRGDASLSVEVFEEIPGNSVAEMVDVPTPEEMDTLRDALRKLTDDVLFERLKTAGTYQTSVIHAVLAERGFDEAELDMARRIRSPDVLQRMQMIDDVSVLPATKARTWLRILLNDASGEVRLQALTALATTNDPKLPELAHEILTRDTDPRVAELASRILREDD